MHGRSAQGLGRVVEDAVEGVRREAGAGQDAGDFSHHVGVSRESLEAGAERLLDELAVEEDAHTIGDRHGGTGRAYGRAG
jgi:hypothetical protein